MKLINPKHYEFIAIQEELKYLRILLKDTLNKNDIQYKKIENEILIKLKKLYDISKETFIYDKNN